MCCPAKRQVEHRFNSTHGAELTSCSGLGYLLASTQLLKTSWGWHCSRGLFLSFRDNPFNVCSSHLNLARPPRMFKELPPGKATRWGHNEEPGYLLKLKHYFLEDAEGRNQGFCSLCDFLLRLLTSESTSVYLQWPILLKMKFNKQCTGTSLVVPWLRLHIANPGGLGSISGQGTRSHMLKLRGHMPWLKILCATKHL